jgi:hypothetical protein
MVEAVNRNENEMNGKISCAKRLVQQNVMNRKEKKVDEKS